MRVEVREKGLGSTFEPSIQIAAWHFIVFDETGFPVRLESYYLKVFSLSRSRWRSSWLRRFLSEMRGECCVDVVDDS